MIKNLLGNGSKDREHVEEMRSILEEMKKERSRYHDLIETARESVGQLKEMHEPIAKAASDVHSVEDRIGMLEQRFAAMVQLAERYETLDDRAEALQSSQQRMEEEIGGIREESDRIRSAFDDIGQKIEIANNLKDRLDAFLETERPFQDLRAEADTIRNQVDGTSDHMARLREQHDRLMDAHKLALTKMEALDRRRDDLGRSLQDKERRVEGVESAVRGLDGVQHTIDDLRREMGSVKTMADLLSQKSAALEAQRETIDRALAQAEQLDRAMRQLDTRMAQQQENERTLNVIQEQITSVRSLHETVAERSSAIAQLQREIDERIADTRQELAAVTDQTKNTVDRFDFERRGMESVTQRVADLRASLSDCEGRYKGLSEASMSVNQLVSQTDAVTERVRAIAADVAGIDDELTKLQTMRRELDEAGRTAGEIGTVVSRIEQSRTSVEAALADLARLSGTQAGIADALEQTRVASDEIARMRERHADTRQWIAEIEQSVAAMRDRAGALEAMSPKIEYVQMQTQRIGDSMAAIEAKREYIEDLHRRLADLEESGERIEARGRELQDRMAAAEERFTGLEAHAEEAERMTQTIASVSASLREAGAKADEVHHLVAGIATRSEAVEALAERTQALRQEIEQRQHAVARTLEDLTAASELRQEAAEYAQQIGETAKGLAATLSKAEARATGLGETVAQLEARATSLQKVESRLDAFDERLTRWDRVDQDITRSLDDIVSRQETVGALQADLERMYAMAEKTAAGVREIAAAHGEIEEGRELLKDVVARLQEVRSTASTIDERKRQLAKAEDRLARAEGLLADVESSLETIEGHKTVVDQAVETAGSLPFLLKQAEAVIEGLREERKGITIVRAPGTATDVYEEDEAESEEELRKAA